MFLNLIYLFLCMHSGIAIASSLSNALVVYDPIIARQNSSPAASLAFILNGQPVVGRTTGLEQVVSASSTACPDEAEAHSSSAASSAELLRKKKVQDGLVPSILQESASSAGAGAGGASSSLSYSDIPLACSGRYGPGELCYFAALQEVPKALRDKLNPSGYKYLVTLFWYTRSLTKISAGKKSAVSQQIRKKLGDFGEDFSLLINSLDDDSPMQDLLPKLIDIASRHELDAIPHKYIQSSLNIMLPYAFSQETQVSDDPVKKLQADILLLLFRSQASKSLSKKADSVNQEMDRKILVACGLLRTLLEAQPKINIIWFNRVLEDIFKDRNEPIPVDAWVQTWVKIFMDKDYKQLFARERK